jgi:DNA-binding NarL/FixJ family response regulator
VRVVVADDSLLLREGVARLLAEAGYEVVGLAADAEQLLKEVESTNPDVAIVDIRMPPTFTDEGLQAARDVRARYPHVGVLVLSQHVRVSYALELLTDGAAGVGYLLKDRVSDLGEFTASVRRVASGGSVLDPDVVAQLVARRRPRRSPVEGLSARELEVLQLMAEGRSNQAIADRLVVTERTVEKHVTSIFTKLGLPASPDDHRRVLAVLVYLGSGIRT